MPIYLDNAATTPVDPEIISGLAERQARWFANPASTHPLGREAGKALEASRARLAGQLGGRPAEVVFTSGGTEALGIALLSLGGRTPGRIAISAVEHSCVREAAQRLVDRFGWTLDVVPVDGEGRVTPAALAQVLTPAHKLVAVMLANNEVGTVNDVPALARLAREVAPRAKFVVDAVQAFGKVPVDVRRLGVDALALTAHKIHGPKGIGALWTRAPFEPVFKGGGQERGLRGGTQSAPLAWALAEAAARMPGDIARVTALRDALVEAIVSALPEVRLVGAPVGPDRLGHNAYLLVPGVPSEPLLNALAAEGLCASAGSACRKGKFSRTLTAMGRSKGEGAFLRLSTGRFTTAQDVEAGARIVIQAVGLLRGAYA